METEDTFGAWLRHRRRALDLTQRKLADQVGCSPITIRKFEAGERQPSRQLARLLARTLAVQPEKQEWFVAFARGAATAEDLVQESADQATPGPIPHNLPAALTTLIGRAEDVAAVCQAVTRPGMRLLTLTGPGGTGKTSLALEAGRRLITQEPAPFPDGITLVELAPVSDPALVLPTIAATLGLKEERSQPSRAALAAYLRSRRHLLLLDNFEQVAAAADHLVGLLEAAPGLHILVTSRSVLHIYGEQEYPVGSLALPDPGQRLSSDALLAYPAVSLFVERAQAAKPSFRIETGNAETVWELCRLLDGLPLAIELAAARCKFLSPAALLAQVSSRLDILASRSRHLTDRQRTLKGAIEWSYNLLNPDERRLFTRLAVFAGEFSLGDATAVGVLGGEAAESQTGGSFAAGALEADDLLEQLAGLVNNSVLQQVEAADPDDSPRFRFLLTVREYALEQLAASGEEERVRDRHATRFLALAEEAQPHLIQAEQLHWFQTLDRSMDNLRAALAWLLAPAAGPTRQRDGGRMVIALQRFWDARGHLQEMEIWSEQALVHREALPPDLLVRLLHISILLATYRSDYDRAQQALGEVRSLARQLGDPTQLATTLHFAGMIAGQLGNYEQADALLSEALSLERQAGPDRLANLSTVLNNLAIVARRLGEYDRAAALLEESLRLKRARADRRAVATSLSTLADLAQHQGHYKQAAEYLRESLFIRSELDDRMGLALSLGNTAALALAQKEDDRATVLYAASQALRQAVQMAKTPIEQEEFEANLALLQERLGEEAFASAWEAGQTRPLAEIIAWAAGESAILSAAGTPGLSPRFIREHLLAGGGMGEIYLGRDLLTGEPVAVKRLRPGVLADYPELPQRLVREAQILHQLNHPNIVRIVDTYQEGDDYLIVMEYVPGGSLRDLLKREGRPSLRRTLAIVLELADALARAHHVGVIHRDLKPENVLLAADGTPRLTDFGISYRLGEGTRLTAPGGTILGTLAYASPEVLGGLDPDHRSDIWSFGVLLYELAAGRLPFDKPELTGTMAAILVDPLPDLAKERLDVPQELAHLVAQMLVREREVRLDSMRRVAAALEDIQKAVGA